jgi:hypothetical protein
VKMAAGNLFRRSTGMKDVRALFRSQTGDFQFLERARRKRGNFAPMLDCLWRNLSRFAKAAIRSDLGKLQREKGQSQFIEFRFSL